LVPVARRALTLGVAVILAGCGPSSTPATSTAPGASAAVVGSAPPITQVAPTALLAPYAAGQTGNVIEGYNVAPAGRPCQSGIPPDHCANQRDGFDIEPANQGDKRVLAPVGGTVAFITQRASSSAGPCVLITTPDNLNLNVCHFDETSLTVKVGDVIARGCVLGTRDTTWIHISLDARHRDATTEANPATAPAVPFMGVHVLESTEYPEKAASIVDQYGPTDSTQSAGAAVISSSNAPAPCSGQTSGASPSPSPNAALKPMPTPTPKPIPKPTPTPTPTPKPTPSLVAPSPPTQLLETVGTLTTKCASSDPVGTQCIPNHLTWKTPAGLVTGYFLFRGGGACVAGPGCPPPLPKCTPKGAVRTLPATATSYTLFSYGETFNVPAWICAFNAAGGSRVVPFDKISEPQCPIAGSCGAADLLDAVGRVNAAFAGA
jgi:hypothetical protein